MFVAFPLPDGSYFQIRHLPLAMIEEIEKKHGVSWILIVDTPQVNGGALADLARDVAIVNDLEPPKLDTAADLIVVSDSLVVVDDAGRRITVADDDRLAWSAPGS